MNVGYIRAQVFSELVLENYFSFRKTFHDSRPTNSKIVYGWFLLLTKEWPEWLANERT